MKLKATLSFALALALMGSGAAFAQTMNKAGKPMTAQQQRMSDCSHQGKGKTGAEHKAFMSSCLKGKTAAATPAAATPAMASTPRMKQQQKMKTCSTEAKTKALKGADRKSFMKTCLSGAPAAH